VKERLMTTRNRTLLNLAVLGLTLAAATLATTANAASVTNSATPPSVDSDDIANMGPGAATQKWFHDIEHDAGQTFTPTADLQLNSFSVQLSSRNDNDADPNEWVLLRLGTITRPGGEFTFTDFYTEDAYQTTDWAAGDWLTFTFDTPQVLTAGVEYGVITDAQQMGSWRDGGIPYRHRTGNDYAGGHMINRGGASTGSDLVFVADLSEPVPEPSTIALASLGILGLLGFRRRRG
jgi:hypothetical protein